MAQFLNTKNEIKEQGGSILILTLVYLIIIVGISLIIPTICRMELAGRVPMSIYIAILKAGRLADSVWKSAAIIVAV